MNHESNQHQHSHLISSAIRRAPKDATNILLNESDDTVIAVLREIEPRLVDKILRHFPAERAEQIKNNLPDRLDQQVEKNSNYPEDSVGRKIDSAPGILSTDATVQSAIDLVRELDKQQVVFTYTYVIDEDEKLQGVVAMRELLLADPNDPITKVMVNNPFRLNAETPIHEVMLEVIHRHYSVYPVCDEQGKFIGRVKSYELFEERAIEISAQPGLMVGVDEDEHLSTPLHVSFRNRHPWLQLNLFTAFLAAFVVGMFEDTISSIVVLAAFLPVLAGQSGNTGCQALAVTIRGMTLGEFKTGSKKKLFTKELMLGTLNGALVGITAALGMLIYTLLTDTSSGYLLAFVVFLAMTISCMASGVAGVMIPLILKRFGVDPATSSAIFLTTATDVLSMGLLLGLATIMVL